VLTAQQLCQQIN